MKTKADRIRRNMALQELWWQPGYKMFNVLGWILTIGCPIITILIGKRFWIGMASLVIFLSTYLIGREVLIRQEINRLKWTCSRRR